MLSLSVSSRARERNPYWKVLVAYVHVADLNRQQFQLGGIALKNTLTRIAVLIPCYNEAVTIAKVIRDFRASLPDAIIYVYDNNSKDETLAAARTAGAVVRREMLQGKGYVVRRMFADIEADIYVLVDGDDTYEAADAAGMVTMLIDEQLDMVNGARVTDIKAAYRPGHR